MGKNKGKSVVTKINVHICASTMGNHCAAINNIFGPTICLSRAFCHCLTAVIKLPTGETHPYRTWTLSISIGLSPGQTPILSASPALGGIMVGMSGKVPLSYWLKTIIIINRWCAGIALSIARLTKKYVGQYRPLVDSKLWRHNNCSFCVLKYSTSWRHNQHMDFSLLTLVDDL